MVAKLEEDERLVLKPKTDRDLANARFGSPVRLQAKERHFWRDSFFALLVTGGGLLLSHLVLPLRSHRLGGSCQKFIHPQLGALFIFSVGSISVSLYSWPKRRFEKRGEREIEGRAGTRGLSGKIMKT